MAKKIKREVCVIDAETDPFKYGRAPKPFAWGVRCGDIYMDFWGPDCTARMLDYLASIETPLIVYAHNGGKFDFFFLLAEIENPIKVIHGRIAKAKLGIHELRDSWLINPQKLSAYKKDEIDYALFERGVREKHKGVILKYLRGDCEYLYEVVSAFVERFGPALTAPGTAMKELKKLHPQYNGAKSHDDKFRRFYYGGRVECFESGSLRGNFKVYDVNSMYPHAMREYDHPHGMGYVAKTDVKLDRNGWIAGFPGCMYFALVEGINHGALPIRVKDNNGGLSFTASKGVFEVCSHELRAAMSLGLFNPTRVIEAYIPRSVQRFAEFVDTFAAEKIAAKASGDKIAEIFAKLMLNSAYGKFGQNPKDFRDYYLERLGMDACPDFNVWELYESSDRYRVWRKRVSEADIPDDGKEKKEIVNGYFDVAIAASITSAARSVLLRAIAGSNRPVYCDTDSLICESIGNVPLNDSAIGAWKLEAIGDRLSIAGKKLYCLWGPGYANEKRTEYSPVRTEKCPIAISNMPVKYASKGVHISPLDIDTVARGGVVEWRNDAPNFSLTGQVAFVKRRAMPTISGRN